MPGVSGEWFEKAESMNSNILLRTVYSTDIYYIKLGQSRRLDIKGSEKMMYDVLQLMCCAFSNFSSSQFAKVWIRY